MAPSSFVYSSWDGVSVDWGYLLRPSLPTFDLLRSSPDEQRYLSNWFQQNWVWLALTRRTTLGQSTKRAIERAGRVVTVYKRGFRVAACKGSFKSGILKAIQTPEQGRLGPLGLWAITAALGVMRDEANSDTVDLARPGPSHRDSLATPLREPGLPTPDLFLLPTGQALRAAHGIG